MIRSIITGKMKFVFVMQVLFVLIGVWAVAVLLRSFDGEVIRNLSYIFVKDGETILMPSFNLSGSIDFQEVDVSDYVLVSSYLIYVLVFVTFAHLLRNLVLFSDSSSFKGLNKVICLVFMVIIVIRTLGVQYINVDGLSVISLENVANRGLFMFCVYAFIYSFIVSLVFGAIDIDYMVIHIFILVSTYIYMEHVFLEQFMFFVFATVALIFSLYLIFDDRTSIKGRLTSNKVHAKFQ